MSIVVKKKMDIPPPPKGQHQVRCDMIVDLGVQASNNPKFRDNHQVYIRWALVHEMVSWTTDEGEEKTGPKTAAMFYNLTFGRGSNLLALMQAWEERDIKDDDDIDIAKYIGTACSIYIKHERKENGDIKAKVTDISPLEEDAVPELPHQPLLYDPDNTDSYALLPKGIQRMIDNQVVEGEERIPI